MRSPEKFTLQSDESTDSSNCVSFLTFVRSMLQNEIKEEFLFCEPLKQTENAVDIKAMVNEYFFSSSLLQGPVNLLVLTPLRACCGKVMTLVKKMNPKAAPNDDILH